MSTDNSIINKVMKLLVLSESSYEEEAKSALAKAYEICLLNDIDMSKLKEQGEQEVHDLYILRPSSIIMIGDVCYIAKVLGSCFNVSVTFSKRRRNVSYGVYGTKDNCILAKYVYKYLSKIYKDLYNKSKATNRDAYYIGLTESIISNLTQVKEATQNSTGVIVPRDPKLTAFENSLVHTIEDVFIQSNDPSYVTGKQDGSEVYVNTQNKL